VVIYQCTIHHSLPFLVSVPRGAQRSTPLGADGDCLISTGYRFRASAKTAEILNVSVPSQSAPERASFALEWGSPTPHGVWHFAVAA